MLWIDYVRELATGADQKRYFLLPGVVDVRLPAVCVRALSTTDRRRYETDVREARDGSVSLEVFGGEGGIMEIPYTSQSIEAGKALLAIPGPSRTEQLSGIAPDGVTSVTIGAKAGKIASVSVTSNFFVAQIPASAQGPLELQWWSADGALIKTVPAAHVPVSLVIAGDESAEIAIPPATVQAGGHQVAEFERGRTVFAQSGCLACHRIGQSGNRGPGPALTHIGSMLSRHGIEHALIDPTAPMPSFKHLPPAKFKALVAFLSELR